jgi:hypothetical protein
MTETEIEQASGDGGAHQPNEAILPMRPSVSDDAETEHQIGELDELEQAIAPPATATEPAPPMPTEITETDLWRMTALSERHEKIKAQIQLLQEQLQRLQSELVRSQGDYLNCQRDMASKYVLSPADRVILPEGGKIVRAAQNGKG